MERHRYASRLVLVIPFIEGHIDRVLSNIERWQKYIPCQPHRGYHQFIDLLFYYHKDITSVRGLVGTLKSAISSHKEISQCFSVIRFANARLNDEEDVYPLGASRMFFRLMGMNTINKYNYMYYMEPDNLPCKQYWLDRIYEEATIVGGESLWMRGSIIRNGVSMVGTWTFGEHMNGNAIYRLDSQQFFDFLALVENELNGDPGKYVESYDIAIYLVRKNRTLIPWDEFTRTASKFQYTDLVQNWYRTEVNATEVCNKYSGTYLVHGRNVI